MDVQTSFKAQQGLAEAYHGPIKTLNDRIEGRIYDDEDDLGRLEKILETSYKETVMSLPRMLISWKKGWA